MATTVICAHFSERVHTSQCCGERGAVLNCRFPSGRTLLLGTHLRCSRPTLSRTHEQEKHGSQSFFSHIYRHTDTLDACVPGKKHPIDGENTHRQHFLLPPIVILRAADSVQAIKYGMLAELHWEGG